MTQFPTNYPIQTKKKFGYWTQWKVFFSLKKFCNNRHNFYTNFYDAHFVVLYRNENCVCLKNENYSASIITGEVLIHERAFCTILYAQFRSSHCNSCFKVLQKNATEVCPHCKEVSQRHKKTKRDGHIILMMLLFKNKNVHGQINAQEKCFNTHVGFFCFSFRATLFFVLMNAPVDINQGIH